MFGQILAGLAATAVGWVVNCQAVSANPVEVRNLVERFQSQPGCREAGVSVGLREWRQDDEFKIGSVTKVYLPYAVRAGC